MKLSVEFPSVSYREGPEGVLRLTRAIETIGYDHMDVFDHVVMGMPIPTPSSPASPRSARWASAGYRSTPPRSSRRAPGASTR